MLRKLIIITIITITFGRHRRAHRRHTWSSFSDESVAKSNENEPYQMGNNDNMQCSCSTCQGVACETTCPNCVIVIDEPPIVVMVPYPVLKPRVIEGSIKKYQGPIKVQKQMNFTGNRYINAPAPYMFPPDNAFNNIYPGNLAVSDQPNPYAEDNTIMPVPKYLEDIFKIGA